VVGNVAILVWGIIIMIWAGTSHYGDAVKTPNPIEAFNIGAAVGSYCVELIYVFLAIFALKLLWQSRHSEGGLWWKTIAVLVGLATPILAFKGSLDPFPTYPANRGVFITIGLIAIAALWYGYLQVFRPEKVRLAAQHAVEHHGVPALDDTSLRPAVTDPA
jgi:hypothetical protein